MKKQKLELTWIGKEKTPKLEPRILLEDTSLSYHAKKRHSENDIFDNVLIHGDNLLALRALEADYAGEVKCVFIDPPYNTGSAFDHYEDGLEHSIWLGLMRDRLEILKRLMANEGSIWITIDDNEAHYLKVLCDEVFGRINFLTSVMWNSRKSKQNDAKISLSHNHVLIYAKSMSSLRLNRMAADEDKFENPDNDPRGPWVADPFDAPQVRVNLEYPIVNPNTGQEYLPPKGRHWRTTKNEYERLLKDGMIVFGKTGKSKPQQKRFLTLAADKGVVPGTWWDDCGTATEATKEIQALYDNELTFDTPKPERLLQRIVHLATNSGDLVLDSFGGSGTTGAVAHKMGRKWIMVELGDHCHTHIAPRLKKVVDGEDQGGISKALEWKGGGGFRYYNLAPSMLEKDRWGNWIISKEFNPAMLSEALCKIMGFKYAPSDEHYWIHGASTETDFIYVTTQTMDQAQLATISQEVGDNRSLLICCGAFRVKADEFPNLTLKKIPRTVLNKCEWGKDDYSLNVQNLPMAKEEPEEKATKKSKPATTMPLFEEAGE